MSRGNRHLIILGVALISFALASTAFSLALYHNSGDIYLDRSRPGFLPGQDEKNDQDPDNYSFPESGQLKPEHIVEFLEHYNAELQRLDSYGDPFSTAPLSDESLGIDPSL